MKPPLRSRAFALLLIVCFSNPIVAQGVVSMNLGGTTWQVSKGGDSEVTAATVPGSIHTDLRAAKKIPDPYFGDNERKVQWVGEAAWTYRRSFDVSADLLAREHLLLRCEGLDTLAPRGSTEPRSRSLSGNGVGKAPRPFSGSKIARFPTQRRPPVFQLKEIPLPDAKRMFHPSLFSGKR